MWMWNQISLWVIWITNGGEILDMNEQIHLNPTSCSLMLSKVMQQFNGAAVPALIYTDDTVKAICAKASLPDPINVRFLNEYNCVWEFASDFDPHKIAITLQQITQWFGYDVIVNCEVVTKDILHEIEQCREEPDPSPSLDITGKNFETPTSCV